MDAPIWCGAPIGFLTQTEDRVQSSLVTALHAALASSLGVDGISIASADEAFSGGPITIPARIDTLRATQSSFRFFGHSSICPTNLSEKWAKEIEYGIEQVLESISNHGDFVDSLYKGFLGSVEEGAYPGRAGRGTVIKNNLWGNLKVSFVLGIAGTAKTQVRQQQQQQFYVPYMIKTSQ